jgi:GNAT superfamily N-acetyltransferase
MEREISPRLVPTLRESTQNAPQLEPDSMPLKAPLIRPAETDAEIGRCFAVMHQLRPHLDEAGFLPRVRRMQAEGYHLAYLAEADGTVHAVAGYRLYDKLVSGRNLYVDDLVTAPGARSRGHGRALLQWLIAQARALGCDQLELDSGVQRFDAHRFYFRERLSISAYHFSLPLRPA